MEEADRPEKRQRVEGPEADDEGPPAPPPADQINAALAKIANHISNSAKFSKASQLLRQLMDAVDKPHRNQYFECIQRAFSDPEHCIDPLLRKDYVRLIKAANLRSEVLSKQQRAQLEVYSIWALLRNELFTDDSFAYNKVVAKIKAEISQLSDADFEQEAAWARVHPDDPSAQQAVAAVAAAAAAAAAQPASGQQQQSGGKQLGQRPVAAAAEEFDPFGLNDFIAKAEAEEAAAAAAAAAPPSQAQEQPSGDKPEAAAAAGAAEPAAPSSAALQQGGPWDPVTLEVMKKQALLDCLIAAKTHQHKLAWARTSVEILIEEVAKPTAQGGFADKFVGGQKHRLQELLRFVNAERAARRSGVNRRPGGKSTGEYTTSFERARAEWGSASWVSARGKVGSQGDAKSQNWLG